MYLLLKPINVIRLKKIILIEDDAAILDTMRWMFGPPEFELITFSNGNKIIDGLFDTPDLFIIDKQLPGIDGLDICSYLKRQATTKDVPVIIMSASAMMLRPAMAAGAAAFIEKPYSVSALRKLVDKCML